MKINLLSKKITFLTIALLAVSLLSYAQDEASERIASAQEYYELGRQAIASSQWRKANEHFKKAEQILDNTIFESSKENIYSASLKIKAKKVGSKPKAKLEPKLSRRDLKLQRRLAIKLAREKLLSDAAEACTKSNWGKAAKLYSQAIKIWPKNHKLWFNLGIAYINKAEYVKAAQMFERTTDLNHRDYEAYYNLGILHESYFADSSGAKKFYKKYIKYAPPSEDKEKVKDWIRYIHLKEQ